MEADIPWFAGVLDARGHLSLNTRRGTPTPRIRVTTNRLGLLATLSAMTGNTVRVNDKDYHRRLCNDHCTQPHIHVVAQSSFWNADCTRATIILHSCLPYMRSARAEAEALLEVGYPGYQPKRNGTAVAMQKLGWELPPVQQSRRGVA
jgi:hypothetical protein